MGSKKQVVLVALAIASCLAADSMLYITLPIFWREAGLGSLWEVGILLSINRFIRLPINPLIGWVYSKIEVRMGIAIAVLLAVLSNLGYFFAHGLWPWIILRSIWGFSWAFFSIGGLLTVIKSAEEDNRGQMMGTYNGLYRLGSLAGMLLGGLMPNVIGFTNTLLFFGLLSTTGLISVFFIKNIGEGDRLRNQAIDVKELLFKPVLVVLATGLVVNMLYRGVITSTLSLVVDKHFGTEIILLGFIIGSSALAGIIQAARWSWEPFLAAKIGKWSDGPRGRVPFLLSSLLLAGIMLCLLPYKFSITPWLIIVALLMVCATALTTLSDALASDVARSKNPISVMTAYTVGNDLGAAIGPLLIYQLLAQQNGLLIGFSGGGLLFIALAMLWYWLTYSNKVQSDNSYFNTGRNNLN